MKGILQGISLSRPTTTSLDKKKENNANLRNNNKNNENRISSLKYNNNYTNNNNNNITNTKTTNPIEINNNNCSIPSKFTSLLPSIHNKTKKSHSLIKKRASSATLSNTNKYESNRFINGVTSNNYVFQTPWEPEERKAKSLNIPSNI